MAHWDDDKEENSDESDLPDEADRDQEGDESTDVVLCRECGATVYEDAAICPKCGEYLSGRIDRNRKPLWILFGFIICLIAMLILAMR